MTDHIKPEFLDVINYAICRAANEEFGERTKDFFRKVGEHHLDEAVKRGFVSLNPDEKPLDNLIGIAHYLESTGYMKKIFIEKLSDIEAVVEMHGVSVTKSSVDILRAGMHPSHYMTNIMIAALRRLGTQAELKDVSFDEEQSRFKEHWKILGVPE